MYPAKKYLLFLEKWFIIGNVQLDGTNNNVAKHTYLIERKQPPKRKRGPGGMNADAAEYT